MRKTTNIQLHIVSFDVPLPADYGGVIEVFYKLRALSSLGVRIHLHCFQYGRTTAPDLKRFCKEVHYYPRKSILKSLPIFQPYISRSRQSSLLLERLEAQEYPILFEGLHCCHYLSQPTLSNRIKLVRMHNIEWQYYQQLAQRETSPLKKAYLIWEAQQLKRYEKKLRHANSILAISPPDAEYLQTQFPQTNYLPAFHPFDEVISKEGRGDYCLYHGNLSVAENQEAALFLIHQVFATLNIPLVIAGKAPNTAIRNAIQQYPHISLVDSPNETKMNQIQQNAQLHILPTFQTTGIKLKLLNALFIGRHCLVNSPMVQNTGLESMCIIKDNAKSLQEAVKHWFKIPFHAKIKAQRATFLQQHFSNQTQAQQLLQHIQQPPS